MRFSELLTVSTRDPSCVHAEIYIAVDSWRHYSSLIKILRLFRKWREAFLPGAEINMQLSRSSITNMKAVRVTTGNLHLRGRMMAMKTIPAHALAYWREKQKANDVTHHLSCAREWR